MNGLKSIIFIAIAIVAFPMHSSASDKAVALEFGEKLREYSVRIETIKCDFVQVRHVSMLTGDVVSAGRFYYKREGNICLEFENPAGNMIVMHDNRFKIVYDGRRNVVSMNSNPMLKQLNNMLTACMTGDIKMMEAGSEIGYADGGDTYIVTISPSNKRAKNQISSIVLTFDKADMSLSRLRMNEQSGDYTEYEFTDKEFNVAVDELKFEI